MQNETGANDANEVGVRVKTAAAAAGRYRAGQ